VTVSNLGVTAIGSAKVTSAMLNSDVFSTAHSWGGQQTFTAPVLGTPASGNLSNCTALPIGSITGLGTGVATFLATPSSANLAAAVTDETGSGALVFGTSPTIATPSFTTGFTIGGTAATGTIPRGNGTNFVASAFTLAAPGTSGNVLTSDGTNWTSAAPSGGGGLTVGTTTITGGSSTDALYNNGGVLGARTVTTSDGTNVTFGPGNLLSTSPTITTPAITTSATVTNNSLGTSTAVGIELTNTTAAAAGAQQYSPCLLLTGQGWKTNATAASQTVNWQAYVLPVQGTANPTANWILQSQINGGGYTDKIIVSSAGILTVQASASYILVDPAQGGSDLIRWGSATGRGVIAVNNGIGFTNSSNNKTLSTQSGGVNWGLARDSTFGWSGTANDGSAASDLILRRSAAATLAFGAADAASPVAQTQSVQNVVAGTSNTAGANWTRDASRGTGTGAGGRHVWRTAPAGSSGTSQNALVEACAIESSGTFKLKTLAFSALPTAIADGEMFYCSDGAVTSGADNTLTSGGSGALAIRINGVWRAFNAQN